MADNDIEFSIIGLDALLKNLDYVSDAVRKKQGRAALRKAGNVIVAAAKQNVSAHDDPATGRKISDNVAMRWNGKRAKSTGDLAFRIGVLKGAVLPKNNEADTAQGTATPHWRLLEFGTKTSPAKPFLRPALADNIGQVTNVFVTAMTLGIATAIKKGKTL